MVSPVITARNAASGLQICTSRPREACRLSDIPEGSRLENAEFRNDPCSRLSEERIAALEKIEHTTHFPAGAIIFMEGQPARGVYVVRQGRVKVLTTNSEGRTLILKIAKPGEALGLNSVITGKPYDVTAEILQPTELAFISRTDFLNFITAHGDACLYFASLLSRDCRAAYEVARSIGLSQSVTERLAKFLLDWVSNEQVTKDLLRATLELTHEEIAQLIGASRETVTRTLGEFKKQRTIELHGSTLVLKNRQALERLAAA